MIAAEMRDGLTSVQGGDQRVSFTAVGHQPRPLPAVSLGGVRPHAITEMETIRHILQELEEGRGGWVVTHNLDHLRRLRHDRSFAGASPEVPLA